MVATIDIFKGSLLETSYYNVYFNIILGGSITVREADRIELAIVPDPGGGFVPTPEQSAMRLVLHGTGSPMMAMARLSPELSRPSISTIHSASSRN